MNAQVKTLLVISVLAIGVAAALMLSPTEHDTMNCKSFPDKKAFDTAVPGVVAGKPYAFSEATGSVTISLRAIPTSKESELLVFSRKVGALVFQGKVTPELKLPIDAELASNEGWDNLSFTVVDRDNLRICSALNDRDLKVWNANINLAVTFLERPEFDDNDMMTMFKVDEL